MIKFTKLTSVKLKVGQSDPHTITSRFSMKGKFGDPSSFPSQVIMVRRVGLMDKRADRWTDSNKVFHERYMYLHTKFGDPRSFPSRVIVVTSFI